jgi:hypothetical protein
MRTELESIRLHLRVTRLIECAMEQRMSKEELLSDIGKTWDELMAEIAERGAQTGGE